MSTIRDVAKAAKVSISTVSNILNNRVNVSDEKYNRVMQAISDLKYSPNFLASNLRTNKFRLVAIVLPELTCINQGTVSAILDTLAEKNYECIICLTHHNPFEETNTLDRLLVMGVAGILLCTCNADNHELFGRTIAQGMPLVFFDSYSEGTEYTTVLYDNRVVCRRLSESILSRHPGKRVPIVTGPQTYLNERDCVLGYREGGLKGETIVVRPTAELAFIDFWNAVSRSSNWPDAAAATNPEIAWAIRRAGAFMGSDIPIFSPTGSDSDGVYTASRNPLLLGQTAAAMLLQYIDSPTFFENRRTVIKSEPITPPHVEPISAKPCKLKALLFDGPTSNALTKTFDAFYRRTGIQVEYELLPYSSLYDRIVVGNSDEDVFMIDYQWLDRLGNDRTLASLDPYLHEGFLNRYSPDILSLFIQPAGTMPDAPRIYTVPVVVNVQLLFYRKDLFNNPAIKRQYYQKFGIELSLPRTWRDFEILAGFFTREQNHESPVPYGTTLQGMDPIFLAEEFFPRQWAFKGRMLSSSGRIILDSIENERALANLKTVWECTPKQEHQEDWSIEARRLIDGNIAMQFTFSTHVPSATSNIMESINLGNIGITDAPGNRPMLGGWYLGINKRSQYPSDAAALISWLAGERNALEHTLLGAFIPRTSVFENIRCRRLFPWIELLQKNIPVAGKREILTGENGPIDNREIDQLLYDAIKKTFTGTTPKQALTTAQEMLKELLSR